MRPCAHIVIYAILQLCNMEGKIGICKLYRRPNGSITINISVEYSESIKLDGKAPLKLTTTEDGLKICIEKI